VAFVDLFFEKTPASGPPWNLLFGELAGPAPSRTLTFAGSFPDLTFAGLARSINPLRMILAFPELVFTASALYQSKTQRPTVARTVTGWDKGRTRELGVDGPHGVATPERLGTQSIWTSPASRCRSSPRCRDTPAPKACSILRCAGTWPPYRWCTRRPSEECVCTFKFRSR
jgi:hypothetical protein